MAVIKDVAQLIYKLDTSLYIKGVDNVIKYGTKQGQSFKENREAIDKINDAIYENNKATSVNNKIIIENKDKLIALQKAKADLLAESKAFKVANEEEIKTQKKLNTESANQVKQLKELEIAIKTVNDSNKIYEQELAEKIAKEKQYMEQLTALKTQLSSYDKALSQNSSALASTRNQLQSLAEGYDMTGATADEFIEAVTKGDVTLGKNQDVVEKAINQYWDLEKAIETNSRSLTENKDRLNAENKEMLENSQAIKDLTRNYQANENYVKTLTNKMDILNNKHAETTATLNKSTDEYGDLNAQVKKYDKTVSDLTGEIKKVKITNEELNLANKKVNGSTKDLKNEEQRLNNENVKLKRSMKEIKESLISAKYAINQYAKNVNTTKKSTDKLDKENKQTDKSTSSLGKSFKKTSKDIGNYSKAAEKSTKSTKGLDSSIKNLDKTSNSFLSMSKKATSALVPVTAGLGVLTGMLTSLSAIDTYDRIVNSYTNAFGEMTNQVNEHTRKVVESTGVSQAAYAKTITQLEVQADTYGYTREEAQKFAIQAGDLAAVLSITNNSGLNLEQTCTRLVSALRGEAEAAELLGLSLGLTAMDEFTEAHKELGLEVEGSFGTLDTATQMQIRYYAAVEQVSLQLGLSIDPVVDAGSAQKAFAQILAQTSDQLTLVQKFTIQFKIAIYDLIIAAKPLVTILDILLGTILMLIVKGLTWLLNIFNELLPTIKEIVLRVGDLISGFLELTSVTTDSGDSMNILQLAVAGVKLVFDDLKLVLDNVIEIIFQLKDDVAKLAVSLQPLIEKILPTLVSVFKYIAEVVIPKVVEAFTKFVEKVLPPLIKLLTFIMVVILPPLMKLLGVLAKIVGQVLVGAFGFLKDAVQVFIDTVGPILIPIINTLSIAFGIVVKIIKDLTAMFDELVNGSGPLARSFDNLQKGALLLWKSFLQLMGVLAQIKTVVMTVVLAIVDLIVQSGILQLALEVINVIAQVLIAAATVMINILTILYGVLLKIYQALAPIIVIGVAILVAVLKPIIAALTVLVPIIGGFLVRALTMVNIVAARFFAILGAIWKFVQAYILPILVVLAKVLISVLSVALTIAIAVFKVLRNILQSIWEFIEKYVLPVIKALATVFSTVLKVAINGVIWVLDGLKAGIGWVLDKMKALRDYIMDFFIKAFEALQKAVEIALTPFHMLIDALEKIIDLAGKAVSALNPFNWFGGDEAEAANKELDAQVAASNEAVSKAASRAYQSSVMDDFINTVGIPMSYRAATVTKVDNYYDETLNVTIQQNAKPKSLRDNLREAKTIHQTKGKSW